MFSSYNNTHSSLSYQPFLSWGLRLDSNSTADHIIGGGIIFLPLILIIAGFDVVRLFSTSENIVMIPTLSTSYGDDTITSDIIDVAVAAMTVTAKPPGLVTGWGIGITVLASIIMTVNNSVFVKEYFQGIGMKGH